jgi:hypothetical protein
MFTSYEAPYYVIFSTCHFSLLGQNIFFLNTFKPTLNNKNRQTRDHHARVTSLIIAYESMDEFS